MIDILRIFTGHTVIDLLMEINTLLAIESGIRVLSLVDFGQNEVYEVPDVVLIEGPLVLQDVRPDHFLSQ